MKITFVENRQQTYFWEAIAERLEGDGHEISWIVQNRAFAPRRAKVHIIPYPKKSEKKLPALQTEMQKIISADRNINYYGGDSMHYVHYDAHIIAFLEGTQPDIVIGESTAFHELLCIKGCRERGILYLQPLSTRYPSDRFSFYLYDTPTPVFGSGETLPNDECRSLVEAIARRVARPYVQVLPGDFSHSRVFFREWLNRMKITCCYLQGERYNTPSPWKKLQLERKLKLNKRRWERLAESTPPTPDKLKVLLPLQLQPENNLDVWGNGHRDQTRILRDLLKSTDDRTVILVKPNPRSKYEMSDELIDVVSSSPRAIPIPHGVSMDDVFPTADLIITVTGTVAMEAILAGKPAATLVRTINNTVGACVFLQEPASVGELVEMVRKGEFPECSWEHRFGYLQSIIRTSYRGTIDNPYGTPSCIHPENVNRVCGAFRHVLGGVASLPHKTLLPTGDVDRQSSADALSVLNSGSASREN